MANTIKKYPITKYYFEVTVIALNGNSQTMSFQEVSGLEGTRDKAEYREGDNPSLIKKQIPAMQTFGELTLKRGTFEGHNEFFTWWNGTEVDPMPDRRTLIISLLNPNGLPIITWNVKNAFPTKFTSTDLNAQNNEVAIETLVLVHEGITVTNNEVLA